MFDDQVLKVSYEISIIVHGFDVLPEQPNYITYVNTELPILILQFIEK